MKKFEYLVEAQNIFGKLSLEDYLNQKGSEGWELVSINVKDFMEQHVLSQLTFKREIL